RHQQRPEAAAILQVREPVLRGTAVEASERAQRHVFLVRRAPPRASEPGARQADQLLEVTNPELLRGLAIAGLELHKPLRHGLGGRHGRYSLPLVVPLTVPPECTGGGTASQQAEKMRRLSGSAAA